MKGQPFKTKYLIGRKLINHDTNSGYTRQVQDRFFQLHA